MCEFSRKLIAWMDHELPPAEAAAVEEHLSACAECRGRFAAYEWVSRGFDAYCDAALASSKPRPALPRWAIPVSAGAAAACAVVVLFVLWHPRPEVNHARLPLTISSSAMQPPIQPPMQREIQADIQPEAQPKIRAAVPLPARAAQKVRPQTLQARARPSPQVAPNWFPAQPVVQIAIPAEAMFAPGAVPEGISFEADMTIAADGSAQWIRLHP